eukprot:m.9530 g.9530  ORF g.9530 m.9530 type:complete len:305 (+) comp9437_c0_seq2:91-1005(+)
MDTVITDQPSFSASGSDLAPLHDATTASTPMPTAWGVSPTSKQDPVSTKASTSGSVALMAEPQNDSRDVLDGADVELFQPSTPTASADIDQTGELQEIAVDDEGRPTTTTTSTSEEGQQEQFGFEGDDDTTSPLETSVAMESSQTTVNDTSIDGSSEPEGCWATFVAGMLYALVIFGIFIGTILIVVLIVAHGTMDLTSHLLMCLAQVALPDNQTYEYESSAARRAHREQTDPCCGDGCQPLFECLSRICQTAAVVTGGGAACFYFVIVRFLNDVFEVDFRPDYEPVECCGMEREDVHTTVRLV